MLATLLGNAATIVNRIYCDLIDVRTLCSRRDIQIDGIYSSVVTTVMGEVQSALGDKRGTQNTESKVQGRLPGGDQF